jgi:hypothetical protein
MNHLTPAIRRRAVRALDACPPGVPTRILPTLPGAPTMFGLKILLPYGLTSTHIGYLSRQVLDAQTTAAHRGSELQLLLVNEWRESVEPYHQLALNPASGRILLCAVGPDVEPALRAIAVAEQTWPEASSRFDLDGAPVNETGNTERNARGAAASKVA